MKVYFAFIFFLPIVLLFQNCGDSLSPIEPSASSSSQTSEQNQSCKSDNPEPLAFPSAKGFGKNTRGGRGGKVLHVTNLKNDGNGSLRWALEEESGARIVVFDVQGQIKLRSAIVISHPFVTLAGQSAPGQGIVISGARIAVVAKEVIIRGMRIRSGDSITGSNPSSRDCISIGGNGDLGVENVIVDSNSLTWAVDETLSIWGTVKNVTLSSNIVAEALKNSIHIDEGASEVGPHSMGTVIGHALKDPNSTGISLVGNLYSSNDFRNPFIKGSDSVEVVNNYIFNHGAGHQAMSIGGGEASASVTVVGNIIKEGRDTRTDPRSPLDLRGLISGSKIFLEGNRVGEEVVQENENSKIAHGKLDMIYDYPFFEGSGIIPLSLEALENKIFTHVGARLFDQGLDVVDRRIVAEIKSGSNRIIDSQEEVGGFEVYNFSSQTVIDTDGDGMPDSFEKEYSSFGFDPLVADDRLDYDDDGYTNIEEYLNGKISGYKLNGCLDK